MTHNVSTRLQWWDHRFDTALVALIKSASDAARRDLPDVLTSPAQVRPEFAELVALTQQRIDNLQADAIGAAAEDVEFVVTMARVAVCADFHSTIGGPESVRASREGRAHARRMHLVQAVWAAEQRVVTVTEAHRVEIEAQVNYGLDAISALDAEIRTQHRMSKWLTYQPPSQIVVRESALEIGLSRVRAALATNFATNSKAEGAA